MFIFKAGEKVEHKKEGWQVQSHSYEKNKTICKSRSDQLDGGEELRQSTMLAGEILRPVTALSGKGAERFKESVLEKKRKKYKVVTLGRDKGKEAKNVKENREAGAREKNKVVSRDRDKVESGKTPQQSKKQGGNGKRSLRTRKIKVFLEKRKAKMQADNSENQNSDLLGRNTNVLGTKAVLTILGVLGGILSLIALVAVPVVLTITLLYNSPLALFLPPLTGEDTVQAVTETYVTEFISEVESLADDHMGYDEGEIYYRDPSNLYGAC